jgi:hypothetical protein
MSLSSYMSCLWNRRDLCSYRSLIVHSVLSLCAGWRPLAQQFHDSNAVQIASAYHLMLCWWGEETTIFELLDVQILSGHRVCSLWCYDEQQSCHKGWLGHGAFLARQSQRQTSWAFAWAAESFCRAFWKVCCSCRQSCVGVCRCKVHLFSSMSHAVQKSILSYDLCICAVLSTVFKS